MVKGAYNTRSRVTWLKTLIIHDPELPHMVKGAYNTRSRVTWLKALIIHDPELPHMVKGASPALGCNIMF